MPSSYGAEENAPGTAWIDLNDDHDLNLVITAIQEADSQCDILITGFHWGTEYTPNPTANQVKFAHAAIDAGSDLVVGTHPHVVQADEIYHDRYIIYSLGNFIMDQMWSEETREGVLLYSYIIDKNIISTSLVPTQIMDYSQVRIMEPGEGDYILERINQAALNLKTV
jgi:poly-gamma-glutamate synthesis protein (capsule biosynthesis protein)